MSSERDYLYLAIEKTGCVVMVRQFDSIERVRRSKIEYLSDNVGILGLNYKTINKGYRLPEDYIHPDDREAFADAMLRAFRTGTDFSYEVRLIGDDGKLRTINMDIMFIGMSENDYHVEFVCHEITRSVRFDADDDSEEKEEKTDVKLTKEFVMDNKVCDYFSSFANASELYSVVLDMNGAPLTEPTGPTSYFGEFYDYLENPQYADFFKKIKNSLIQDTGPLFMEFEDYKTEESAGERRIAAAPVFINGICCAMWLLYAHNSNQAKKLFKVYNYQWNIASVISDHLTRLYNRNAVSIKDENKRAALEFEIKEKKLISKLISEVEKGSTDFYKYFEKAGKILDIDYVVYYVVNKDNPEKMDLMDYWAKKGKSETEESVFEWKYDHYDPDFQKQIRDEGIVIDRKNMTNRMRVEIFEGNARAVMVFPIRKKGKYYGRLIFIENTRERAWNESEISFGREMSKIISKSFINVSGSEDTDSEKKLIMVLDNLDMDIFIRNNETGAVLYANDRFIKDIKMNPIGQDSFRMIPKLNAEVPAFSGELELMVDRGKTMTFTRYINQLGGIFDVTDINITWKNGEDASVILLVPSSDQIKE